MLCSSKNKLDKSKMLKKILSVWYEAKSIRSGEKNQGESVMLSSNKDKLDH